MLPHSVSKNVFEEDVGLHSYGLLTPQHGVEDVSQQNQLPGKVTHTALGLTLFIGNQPSHWCGHTLNIACETLIHCWEGTRSDGYPDRN